MKLITKSQRICEENTRPLEFPSQTTSIEDQTISVRGDDYRYLIRPTGQNGKVTIIPTQYITAIDLKTLPPSQTVEPADLPLTICRRTNKRPGEDFTKVVTYILTP